VENDDLWCRIWSAGIYFDNNKFTNKTYFAPFAYKTELNTRKYQVEDLARYEHSNLSFLLISFDIAAVCTGLTVFHILFGAFLTLKIYEFLR
jgi:hypothetical protein